jgi:hypothetical protein
MPAIGVGYLTLDKTEPARSSGPVEACCWSGDQRFLHFCEIGTVLVSPFAK